MNKRAPSRGIDQDHLESELRRLIENNPPRLVDGILWVQEPEADHAIRQLESWLFESAGQRFSRFTVERLVNETARRLLAGQSSYKREARRVALVLSGPAQTYTVDMPIEGLRLEEWTEDNTTFKARDFLVCGVTFRSTTPELAHTRLSVVPWYTLKVEDLERVKAMAEVAVQAGDPQRARELATSYAEQALDILYLWTQWGQYVDMHVGLLGRSGWGRDPMLIRDEAGATHGGSGSTRVVMPFVFGGKQRWELRETGMSNFIDLPSGKTPTEGQRRVLGAARWHSAAVRESSIREAFIKESIALETLLTGEDGGTAASGESIASRLGERVAFLLGATVDERRQLWHQLKDLYSSKGSSIRHGGKGGKKEVTEDDLWRFTSLVVPAVVEFATKFGPIKSFGEFVEWVEQKRFQCSEDGAASEDGMAGRGPCTEEGD